MTDEPEVPAEEIVISDAAELDKAIAEHDAKVDREVQRLSRRGFVVAGVATVAAYGAWKLLHLASREGDVPWPLRRGLETNEKLAEAYFSTRRLSREFPPSAITTARVNGGVGLQANYDPDNWRMQIEGMSGQSPATLSLADIKSFPRRDMTTELRCIEGWSIVVHWTGARLADVMAKFPPPPRTPYVAMESPGRGYYVGLDMLSCMHPQTLLAYELNGAPLAWQHGAPLRLAMPVKYGYKQIKRIATIRYTNVRPPDFWGDRGYDWYGGH
ncbi:MAG: molybdopterin-dependent oxidoreductase [Acidobacteriota bacterium]|nr:molybdopterin-dependent oxidoreductase [Acidobacteriota bacterium]